MSRAGLRQVWWFLWRTALAVAGCFALAAGWLLVMGLWMSEKAAGLAACGLMALAVIAIFGYWAYEDGKLSDELKRR